MVTITFDRIQKRFGDFVAVDDLSLEIRHGELVCLLGPSGCGKTTTLRMVAGLETPTAGEIRFDGARVNDLPPQRRGVGLVFQNYALFTHLTVYENLAFGLRIQRIAADRVDREVHQMAMLLELENVLEVLAGRLDLSTMQRVALARTLITRPKVLLLDEPLNNIRPGLREAMRAELRRLQQETVQTAIYVTHDQEEAMSLADRIVIMRAGKVEQVGTPDQIYQRPRNTFVAGFVGAPGMNFLPVTVAVETGGPVIAGPGFTLVAQRWAARIRAGQQLILGIRPEAIVLRGPVQAEVTLVQLLGPEQVVELSLNGHRLKALIPRGEAIRAGEVRGIDLPETQVVLFDAHTGDALDG